MVKVKYKKKGLLCICSNWFSAGNKEIISKCDLAFYFALPKLPSGYNKNILIRDAFTLITDLTCSEEELMDKIHSATKYKIRRAKKDGVTSAVFDSEYISKNPSVLDEFAQLYDQFLKSKKLSGKCDLPLLKACVAGGNLVIICARFNDQNLVYHVYITDGTATRLHYSSSLFREVDDDLKTIIGRANRLLHWTGITLFKDRGYKVYDWGGYSKRKDLKNINLLKDGFGGTKLAVFHICVPCSFLGSTLIFGFRMIAKACYFINKIVYIKFCQIDFR
ncbi:MAG: GNAT family N-acetyltransferase [Desulfosporosinus sp.]|nr:GNAT family N-acetyltransferase [Desulfosporosinus sp.]